MEVVWRPQRGPQKALIDCPVYEIFYGGARGGGKTDGVLGKMGLKAERYGSHFNAVFFRRELPQLDDAIERSQEIYGRIGAKFQDQKKTWRFPGGGRLRFRPLERTADAEKYQGQNLTDACIEEAGNFPDPAPIKRLHGALRSAHGVPVQMHLTGNPGGPGQQWIKERYVDHAPLGMEIIRERFKYGEIEVVRSRVFIPAKVWDNKILLATDPDYVANLHLVGSDALVQAWLDGNWDAVEGAFFDCWGPQHIIKPFKVPDWWMKFRSMDWGSARPFSVGWWAVASDSVVHPDKFVIPRGALVRYREWYGKKEANVGLKMTAEKVAQGVIERTPGEVEKIAGKRYDGVAENVGYTVADPSMFAQDGGPSLVERMTPYIKGLRRADNRRIATLGHLGGWDQMRQRLIGEDRPMIYCFDTCRDSIRTIPVLQHDDLRPEDLDTESEDHAADEWRYACMSRPYTKPKPAAARPIDAQPTWDEQMARHFRFKRQMRAAE